MIGMCSFRKCEPYDFMHTYQCSSVKINGVE